MYLFKTRLKILLRSKSIVFWTLFFPIILSIFFKFTLANVGVDTLVETFNVGVIENTTYPMGFLDILKSVEYSENYKVFSVKMADLDAIKNDLDQNKIVGYVEYDEDSEQFFLTVKEGGIYATILKSFLDEYVQTTAMVKNIIIKSPANLDRVLAELEENIDYLRVDNKGTNNPTYMLTYFYALLGMAIMYGGYWGITEITDLQANLSAKGIRMSISGTKRIKLLLINMLSAFLIHIAEIMIFLLFVNFVLGISFGEDTFLIILLCILGSIAGISFGAFIGIVLKRSSEGTKTAITTLVGILGGALSGMMYPNIKYWVRVNFPILSYINPVGAITDGLYSLYYYPTKDRYFMNMGILLIMSIVFIVGTYLNFRRDDYESV